MGWFWPSTFVGWLSSSLRAQARVWHRRLVRTTCCFLPMVCLTQDRLCPLLACACVFVRIRDSRNLADLPRALFRAYVNTLDWPGGNFRTAILRLCAQR